MRVWGAGCRVLGVEFMVWGLGSTYPSSHVCQRIGGRMGFGFRVSGFGFQVAGCRFWISDFVLRVPGSELRVSSTGEPHGGPLILKVDLHQAKGLVDRQYLTCRQAMSRLGNVKSRLDFSTGNLDRQEDFATNSGIRHAEQPVKLSES